MNGQTRTKAALVIALGAAAMALGGCQVKQTEEGELPDVDVTAQGGQVPEYEVDTADVDVTTREETVTVPDVDINTREETVPVPDVDVTMPDEQREDQPDEDPPDR